MKKIGILALTLVIALGALGIGYASWTDSVSITGTVNTGTVGINAVYFSGTDIYKDLSNDALVAVHWMADAGGQVIWTSGSAPASNVLVASAGSTAGKLDDTIDITFVGAFPTDELTADFVIESVGTVPVIVTADFTQANEMLKWLWDNGYVTVYACKFSFVDGRPVFGAAITGPVQLHQGDMVKVWLTIDLPQADELGNSEYDQEDFMNQNWDFTAVINAIQWNEFVD